MNRRWWGLGVAMLLGASWLLASAGQPESDAASASPSVSMRWADADDEEPTPSRSDPVQEVLRAERREWREALAAELGRRHSVCHWKGLSMACHGDVCAIRAPKIDHWERLWRAPRPEIEERLVSMGWLPVELSTCPAVARRRMDIEVSWSVVPPQVTPDDGAHCQVALRGERDDTDWAASARAACNRAAAQVGGADAGSYVP